MTNPMDSVEAVIAEMHERARGWGRGAHAAVTLDWADRLAALAPRQAEAVDTRAEGRTSAYTRALRGPLAAPSLAGQREGDAVHCNDPMCDQVLAERDRAEDVADRLAQAVGRYFGQDVGEHSNLNCPWDEALDIIENAEPLAATPAGKGER